MTAQEKAAILTRTQDLTRARLKALLDINPHPQHLNADASYTPAQWWVDAGYTERHTLQTAAGWQMKGNTMTISLTFNILQK